METYTEKTKEELVEAVREIIRKVKFGVVDLTALEVAGMLEEAIGQRLKEDGLWCPPNCTPESDTDQRSVVSREELPPQE